MLKQTLQFKLQQKLSPQQIQLMKLIQLPTQAFEERVKQEVEENMALESGKEETDDYDKDDLFDHEEQDYDHEEDQKEDFDVDDYLFDDDIPGYSMRSNNYSDDDEDKVIPIAAGKSFHQSLKSQLNTFSLTDHEFIIAEFLVGSIDDSGYIRRTVDEIVDDLAFTQNIMATPEEVNAIIKKVIHQLEPSGVGSRDLRETLLIQLERKNSNPARLLAINILTNAFDAFVKKHYKKLMNKYDVSEDQLKAAIREIEKLNPKPGGSYAGNNKCQMVYRCYPSTSGDLICDHVSYHDSPEGLFFDRGCDESQTHDSQRYC